MRESVDKQEKAEKLPPQRKRQQGKRSDPDYIQVGAYIKRSTDKSVKRLLIDEDDLDFSDLVEKLLKKWIEENS
ncbi:MAG: hypothetical protein HC768_23600 [Acaryochloris sp. CRU_2_0]|nr:hypothetical protein [Acaryochloris sp. CRU_2_0]